MEGSSVLAESGIGGTVSSEKSMVVSVLRVENPAKPSSPSPRSSSISSSRSSGGGGGEEDSHGMTSAPLLEGSQITSVFWKTEVSGASAGLGANGGKMLGPGCIALEGSVIDENMSLTGFNCVVVDAGVDETAAKSPKSSSSKREEDDGSAVGIG